VTIRPATAADWPAMWPIFQAVVAGRDTYTFPPDTAEDVARRYFLDAGVRAWVAEIDGRVAGMYKLVPNHPGLGDHVANASFMVAPDAAGRGLGRALAEHCLDEARRAGFRAMQFNFVVSTNVRAVRLWQSLGFRVVGTLPGAFRHGALGEVDALVMFREL
jgi:L-amino acid N-acyltransferase YncA